MSLKKNWISFTAFSGESEPCGILLHVQAERLADRSIGGIRRVRRSHDIAIASDGIFALQHLHHDRTRRHVLAQLVVKGAFGVHLVELLRVLFAERSRFCATMRNPPSSRNALILPVTLRAVASGLMIDSVRSTAMVSLPFLLDDPGVIFIGLYFRRGRRPSASLTEAGELITGRPIADKRPRRSGS